MTSRVFIPQFPMKWHHEDRKPTAKIDLSPAQDYGEITVLLPGNPLAVPRIVLPMLHAGLSTFREEHDYFLAVGHPVLIAWAAAVLMRYTDTARFLEWNRDLRVYNTIPLSIIEGATACLTVSP